MHGITCRNLVCQHRAGLCWGLGLLERLSHHCRHQELGSCLPKYGACIPVQNGPGYEGVTLAGARILNYIRLLIRLNSESPQGQCFRLCRYTCAILCNTECRVSASQLWQTPVSRSLVCFYIIYIFFFSFCRFLLFMIAR